MPVIDENARVTPIRATEPTGPPATLQPLVLNLTLALALVYLLLLLRALLLPVVAAVSLAFLLRPAVASLRRRARIPPALGAPLVVGMLALTLGAAAYSTASPIGKWRDRAPTLLSDLQEKFRTVREPVEELRKTASDLEEITSLNDKSTPVVRLDDQSVSSMIIVGTQDAAVGLGVTLLLLTFILAGSDGIVRKLSVMLPDTDSRLHAVAIFGEVEREISVYLLTVTAINCALGVAVGVMAWSFGLPNPVVWGVLAGLANFVPYIGALLTAGILCAVALVSLDTVAAALMVVPAFAALNVLEAYVVTPNIVGNQLQLSPLAVLCGVLFFGWLWGWVGALFAVPVLMILRVTSSRVPAMRQLGVLLGQ